MALFDLFRRKPSFDAPASRLYVSLVEQARSVPFYSDCGVPDTMDGRFDLLALHAFLLMRRLGTGGEQAVGLSQAVFDLMFADMDQNLREVGFGDMGIGKRVKRLAENFMGRVAAYHLGLDGNDEELAEALRRNLYRKAEPTDAQLAAMAAYMRREDKALAAQDIAGFMEGRISFGPPVTP